MPVEGTVDDAKYRLRTNLADGTIDGHDFDVSLNADNGAVFVEFPDEGERVRYAISDMVRDAHEVMFVDDDGA